MSTATPLGRASVLAERLRILEQRDSLEHERRVRDIKFSRLSKLTGIPYKRVWRYFRDDGSLDAAEVELLRSAISASEAAR